MEIALKKALQMAVAGGFVMATAATSTAKPTPTLKERCAEDMLDTPQAAARNAWARNCNIIEADEEMIYNRRGLYVTFAEYLAPWDVNQPCPGTSLTFKGTCIVSGCYTPMQRVMFSGQYLPISQAGLAGVSTFSAMSDESRYSTLGQDLVEEEIESFVVGDERNEVLRIATANGLFIEVTDKHPMVDAEGNITSAKSVVQGDTRLMTAYGTSLVTSVTTRRYDGKVWNIEPVTTRTLGNILLAEGFVTGSIRYQNEWAEDATRLNIRDTIDTSTF